VEDNAVSRELAHDLLEASGHEVSVAVCATELRGLFASLGERLPDVVLMDIRLPDGDGITLLKEMRKWPALERIPAVAVTAHAMAGDDERLRAAGFDAVITKPLDTRTFCAQVEAWAQEGA
jgi:CheY-like chemotaxis protein